MVVVGREEGGDETTPQHTRSEHIFRSISLASARINASESAHIFHILFAQSEEERRDQRGGGVGRECRYRGRQPQQAFCQCNKSLRVKWLAGRQKVQCSRARETRGGAGGG